MFNLDLSAVTGAIMKSLEPQFEVVRNICKSVSILTRVLSQEYGLPAHGDESRFQARSLSKVPLIVEETIALGVTKAFNLEQLNQNIIPSRGFYRNIGADPFKVVIIGADGQPSNAHTLLSRDTIAITTYVTKIQVTALTTPATIQILAQ